MQTGENAYYALVKELRDGNRLAASHLDDRYRTLLIDEAIHAYSVCREDAEELVNDVLLAVITRIHTFAFRSSGSDFHRWVNAILRNRIRDYRRRAGLQAVVCFSRTGADIVQVEGESSPLLTGDRQDQRSETMRDIMDVAMDALKSWERILLWCRVQGVSYREIETFTGKRSSILRASYARVRRKFVIAVERRLEGEQVTSGAATPDRDYSGNTLPGLRIL